LLERAQSPLEQDNFRNTSSTDFFKKKKNEGKCSFGPLNASNNQDNALDGYINQSDLSKATLH
jgi:hypothetical protein